MTRKERIEKEVERRVKVTLKFKVMEALLEENQEEIEKLQKRIRKLYNRIAELEKVISRIRPEGTIKGFYLAEDGDVEEVEKE